MPSSSISRNLHSFSTLVIIAAAAFICCDLLPVVGMVDGTSYLLFAFFEAILTLLLISAWRDHSERLPWVHSYLFFTLMFIRLASRFLANVSIFWAFRTGAVYSPDIGFIGYLCIIALHPNAYLWMQNSSRNFKQWFNPYRMTFLFSLLALFILSCFLFRSFHITRDGYDWIDRSTKAVWHLYMREPLTIGLFQFIANIAWNWWGITSFAAIGFVSIAAGVWWIVWANLLIMDKWSDDFDRLLAWLLVASSGGIMILFFAHIEVYPVFIASLMPFFYYAHRYLQGKSGAIPVVLSFSIAFLCHLSAGWLLPAFVLLPLLCQKNNAKAKDFALFIGLFGLIQAMFWGFLIVVYYEASLSLFLTRLHETFFVGLDRAMFLPHGYWFQSWHLIDLANAYIYYSLPCCLLLPVLLIRKPSIPSRETCFWIIAAGVYFLYSFSWNPDRGYPEDWDLFSPFATIAVLLVLHLLLPVVKKASKKDGGRSEQANSIIYITAVGTIVFTCSQIYFHHIIPFVRHTF